METGQWQGRRIWRQVRRNAPCALMVFGALVLLGSGMARCWDPGEGIGRAPVWTLQNGGADARVQAAVSIGDEMLRQIHALEQAAQRDDELGVQARATLERVRRRLN